MCPGLTEFYLNLLRTFMKVEFLDISLQSINADENPFVLKKLITTGGAYA